MITDKTPPDQKEKLVFELELAHAPDKVWRAITEPELLKEWLLPAIDFKLEKGASFMFKTQPYPGWDGTVSCEVIEVTPKTKLVYAWRVPFLDTTLAFTLDPTSAGTRLTIEQRGFNEKQAREFGGAVYGWKMMTGKLVELLAKND